MNNDNPQYLRDAAMYGPERPTVTPNIRGWWTPAGWYVCAHHAGRILERGCQLPQGSEPVWKDRPEPFGVCCVCE